MTRFRVVLDLDIPSKKNARKPSRWGGQYYDPEMRARLDAIRDLIAIAWRREGVDFGDDSVSVSTAFDYVTRGKRRLLETTIEVERIGPRPKRFSGRKHDADGMYVTILDELQRAGVLRNDNQVARHECERRIEGEVA